MTTSGKLNGHICNGYVSNGTFACTSSPPGQQPGIRRNDLKESSYGLVDQCPEEMHQALVCWCKPWMRRLEVLGPPQESQSYGPCAATPHHTTTE